MQTYNRVKGTVNTFTKRVYEVDFIKMDIDDTKSIIEVLNFLGYFVTTPLEELQRDELIETIKEQGFLEINTLEGVERLFSGEVVVRGVKGEFYPVSYDNFIKVYDIYRAYPDAARRAVAERRKPDVKKYVTGASMIGRTDGVRNSSEKIVRRMIDELWK